MSLKVQLCLLSLLAACATPGEVADAVAKARQEAADANTNLQTEVGRRIQALGIEDIQSRLSMVETAARLVDLSPVFAPAVAWSIEGGRDGEFLEACGRPGVNTNGAKPLVLKSLFFFRDAHVQARNDAESDYDRGVF